MWIRYRFVLTLLVDLFDLVRVDGVEWIRFETKGINSITSDVGLSDRTSQRRVTSEINIEGTQLSQ